MYRNVLILKICCIENNFYYLDTYKKTSYLLISNYNINY